ncbi:MAG: hypothetical protein LBV60_14260 [Streptomyces sp.]|jgi:hypothetical protein|nr:hypothetical protein [Streptomyces sp.]
MGKTREVSLTGVVIVGGMVALALVYMIGVFVFGGAGWITAPFRGEAEKRENTVGSGQFRQAAYEQFFDLCEAVQNAEGSIQALKEEREHATAARKTQIDQSITALKATRIESVNDYNAKATQEHHAPFRDRNLPYRLDAGTEKTTCTN